MFDRFRDVKFRNQFYLGAGQLAAHLSLIYVALNFSWAWFTASLFAYFLMTSIGVSVTAHRYLTHRSFEMPRAFEILGSLFFTLSLQGSTIAWVAMHREHHKFADRGGDPHNPGDGFWRVHFLSMFYSPRLRYVLDLLGAGLHQSLHRHYWAINLAYAAALFIAGGWTALIYLHLFPAFLCWQGIAVAKTFAHKFGYRNFDVGDDSRNIPFLGYLTFGEAWHNNHHAAPRRYSFAHHWYEWDISASVIELGRRYLGFRLRTVPPAAQPFVTGIDARQSQGILTARLTASDQVI